MQSGGVTVHKLSMKHILVAGTEKKKTLSANILSEATQNAVPQTSHNSDEGETKASTQIEQADNEYNVEFTFPVDVLRKHFQAKTIENRPVLLEMIAGYIAYIAKKYVLALTPQFQVVYINHPDAASRTRALCVREATGVYRRKVEPKIYIDITGIKELRVITTEPTLVLGGSVSLTEAMELFYDLSKMTQYAYTKVLADHIDLIANVPVRNAGTIAGNLSIKHQYNEFPSDMFLMLETVGATLNIRWTCFTGQMICGLRRYSRSRVDKQQMSDEWKIESQTRNNIMPRAQNAHAYVNAGFLMKLSEDGTGKVVQKPNIVFGGIDPQFLHAIDTEKFLIGKSVLDEQVLQGALSTLDAELLPDYISPDAVPEYRKGLAKALFYKFILSLAKAKAKKSLISGGDLLTRPLSSAKQTYETDKSVWPLNQPVPKLEALAQCSGEAAYVNDHPAIPGELFGAFVVTTIGRGNVSNIDPKEALGATGVNSLQCQFPACTW
uniref:FAD-binding PCMH-type domain-containing protein n=1 Tax=Timema cristinae TaxID=61476 RepID=A0A7R9GZ71_TIMCR|nr:unnamed protein product [Timema cristinae]